MSDYDSGSGSGSGSGRKGFVRDVMRRISPTGSRSGGDPNSPLGGVEERSFQSEVEQLQDAIRFFGSDSHEFRQRLDRVVADYESLRRRFDSSREQIREGETQNEKLVNMLQEAKQQIEVLKEEVDKLCAPPNTYGVFTRPNKDGTAEIIVDGRSMRVNVHPNLDPFQLEEGQLVVLNEAFNVIEPAGYTQRGEIASVVEVISEHRCLVTGHMDDERVVTLAEPLRSEKINVGDHLMIDTRTQYAFEKMPKSSVEEVMLEEIPDVSYEEIGGLGDQIEVLRDSVELPYLYPEIFAEFELKPPKGILLYGPPGCGKTMIAKAVANSLARKMAERTGETTTAYFLNVKGPELLNKYVGETESKLREVFKKAREKAAGAKVPVVIFFDEMDSLFRMRGSGISSDMEATVVAQFLSEIDGVESLENVIVIGASNRQDLIDPAVLRPGRLDLKVKVSRPDEKAAREIFSKYLTDKLPIDPEAVEKADSAQDACAKMIDDLIKKMYSTGDDNKFLEVTYAKGEREIFYFKDFSSGAMIQNIVSRAKRKAVKRAIEVHGITADDLMLSVSEEFKENEDLPNTTNPDDWARISGRKGERIINVRTLITGLERKEATIETVPGSGQYL